MSKRLQLSKKVGTMLFDADDNVRLSHEANVMMLRFAPGTARNGANHDPGNPRQV